MILKELFRENLEVFTLTNQSRIFDAASLMQEKAVGSIVILDESESVVGMITDRDIALSVALGAATPDSYVTEVMSAGVETIHEEMSLFDVARFFRTVNYKRLPVVDSNGLLVGIVSVDDVMALLAREMFDTCNALESKLGHMV